jgi:hypothetical protein
MEQCGQRYHERMADISEKVVSHIASMDADSILSRSSQVEKIDTPLRVVLLAWIAQRQAAARST